jgi:hypothetical protein
VLTDSSPKAKRHTMLESFYLALTSPLLSKQSRGANVNNYEFKRLSASQLENQIIGRFLQLNFNILRAVIQHTYDEKQKIDSASWKSAKVKGALILNTAETSRIRQDRSFSPDCDQDIKLQGITVKARVKYQKPILFPWMLKPGIDSNHPMCFLETSLKGLFTSITV